jgi:hypothetical protein
MPCLFAGNVVDRVRRHAGLFMWTGATCLLASGILVLQDCSSSRPRPAPLHPYPTSLLQQVVMPSAVNVHAASSPRTSCCAHGVLL